MPTTLIEVWRIFTWQFSLLILLLFVDLGSSLSLTSILEVTPIYFWIKTQFSKFWEYSDCLVEPFYKRTMFSKCILHLAQIWPLRMRRHFVGYNNLEISLLNSVYSSLHRPIYRVDGRKSEDTKYSRPTFTWRTTKSYLLLKLCMEVIIIVVFVFVWSYELSPLRTLRNCSTDKSRKRHTNDVLELWKPLIKLSSYR